MIDFNGLFCVMSWLFSYKCKNNYTIVCYCNYAYYICVSNRGNGSPIKK